MSGYDSSECVPCLLAIVMLMIGLLIAYQGAQSSNGAFMLVGLVIVLGVLVLLGKGKIVFDF
ncbi:MAG: hypothetical protein DRO87_09645 [Candidatus Thorarchaeota archaeon]|nr:MAG: hypothetical protein DRO87_09645 [Candidatus Thorarchaeota archaeon]